MGKSILVFSDSHGSISSLTAVLEWAKEHIPPKGNIYMAVCLGDGISDITRAANISGFFCDWKTICGNNDYGVQAPEAGLFDFEDRRFFITHGHRYNLYNGCNTLINAAKNSEADAVLFGHTHVPYFKNVNGVTLINPGSISRPRSKIGATFAIVECNENMPLIADFYGIGSQLSIKKVNI